MGEHGLAMWCQWNQLCQVPGFQLVKITVSAALLTTPDGKDDVLL